MREKSTLLRLQQFRCEGARRQVLAIERMIFDFRKKSQELEQQIKTEETKAGVCDEAHFEYPMTARSMKTRKDNLEASREELEAQLDVAKQKQKEEEAELRRLELLIGKEMGHMPQNSRKSNHDGRMRKSV